MRIRRINNWIIRKLGGYTKSDLEKKENSPITGNPNWSSIKEIKEDDIFIVAYPKSGMTWFQNILTGIVYGIDPALSPDTLVQELVPDIHSKKFYKRFSDPMFFKSHHQPQPNFRRVIYITRDGRDAMVSYYHFLRNLSGQDPNWKELILEGKGLNRGWWHEHVEGWLQNPYDADIIYLKYEQLKLNPLQELQRVCEFLNIEKQSMQLQFVIEQSSFSKMQKKERTLGWNNRKWPKEKEFIRKGVIGDHKNDFPEPWLKAFLEYPLPTLEKLGYD